MPRNIIRTSNAPPPPRAYSQAVKAAGLIFVSGTGPLDPKSGRVKGDTIQAQTFQCVANISAILEAAGSSLDKVVNATVILSHDDDFVGMNEAWLECFPVDPPARQGAKQPMRIPGVKVCVAVIAEA